MNRTRGRNTGSVFAPFRKGALRIREVLGEIVFPEGAVCLGCGRISDGHALCSACRAELENGELLESWNQENIAGVPAWSIKPHRGLARKLVLTLKHGSERRAGAELTGMLRNRPDYFPSFPPDTVVTWVPMPKRRRMERGIDHGRALAEGAAEELGLTCRALLLRMGGGRPQARLSMVGRERNLKNAFAPAEKITFPVLLVDDVLTTGTTARRCIDALRAAGAKDITFLAMTRAVGDR